jgi:hypothetical protein
MSLDCCMVSFGGLICFLSDECLAVDSYIVFDVYVCFSPVGLAHPRMKYCGANDSGVEKCKRVASSLPASHH